MIDLLTLALADTREARPDQEGVTILRPWGRVTTAPLSLDAGWYLLEVQGSALCLQLYDEAHFRLIELSAEPDAPAYVRLQSGTYTPKLFAGVRPGHYSLTQARLRPLGVLLSAGLLGGRLIQALQGGISLSRIMAQARQAFKPKATFGLRARANPGPSRLGVLTRQDLQRKETDTCAIAGGPIFLIAGDRPDNQTYDRYTLDPEMPHDFVVTLTDGDRLTPDALQRMAEALAQRPETDVLIVDKWINGQPTAHIAFDPLLYSDGYPTPHVIRRGYVPTGAWRDQQTRHAVLSVPVATGLSAPVHSIAVTPPDIRPPVSIIIPTRDRADLLKACLAGLFDATLWPHEVIIVDNGSVEPAALDLFASYAEKGLRVVRADIPFNFSSLCNLGAAAARHDYLVFLNNDVVLHQSDWLARMMALAVQSDAGAVGARLYYADKRLQHGGVMLGLTQLCGHLWRGLDLDAQQTEPRLVCNSLRAAVTAALLCVDRRKFDAVGGFDEIAFPVTLNDVDLCLKLYRQGWYSILAAGAEAYHLEGESRGDDEDETKARRRHAELTAFQAKWHDLIADDPWLPAAVMRSTEIFGLK